MTAIVFARRALLRGMALALIAGAVGAYPLGASAADVAPRIIRLAATAAAGPIAPIQQLGQTLLTVMKQGRTTTFAQRVNELTPAIEAALDLPDILRVAVGPGWSGLTPNEQRRLLDVFRQYTVASYVDNFNSYDGQTLTVAPHTRALRDGAQVVRTEIIPRDGTNPHAIDYVMHKTADGAWKAIDVLADGTISRVAVLRSDFSAMLARGGASALEASLQQKTTALASG